MRQMRYCGPLRELSGKTALVRPHEKDTENKCLAQFDGKDDWRVGPEHKLKHPETGALLCLDWHEFPRAHFQEVVPDDPCDFMMPGG